MRRDRIAAKQFEIITILRIAKPLGKAFEKLDVSRFWPCNGKQIAYGPRAFGGKVG